MRRLRERIEHSGASSSVVMHLPNIYYLTGFTGSAGVLYVEAGRATLFTDGRYTVQAREELKHSMIKAEISRGSALAALGAHIAGRKGRATLRVAYDPSHFTMAAHRDLLRAAGPRVNWQAEQGWVEALRAVKSVTELTQIRKAARLISDVFEHIVRRIRPGITELELAAEVDFRMRILGAEGPSFETIVASGPRSALPHARPTSKRLRINEFVVLDLGAILGHYCSDLTRTVYLGKASKRVKTWYKAVLEAQAAAIQALDAGVVASVPDLAARRVLDSYGLGKFFVHSTGHGLGIEVHEDPKLADGQKRLLEAGMVVTVEPGVYVEGTGGVRIEDDVAIHPGRTEVLTTASRELLEL
ncbi:MAG: aminopeptidase P family protein [Candidatus Acidiferrales bacterium]